MPARPPLLILAVGNPSRGDDALGPLLLEQLAADGLVKQGGVELLTDFQLQVEHALDLAGRRAVLFVDAAHPGTVAGVTLTPLQADTHRRPQSHALAPAEVLRVACDLGQALPQAWLLALPGMGFDLGAAPSAVALQHLAQAVPLVHGWVAAQRAAHTAFVPSGAT